MQIVLAIDGSPSSEQARDLAASLPWPPGTSVTLLTAFDIPTPWLPDGAMTAVEWPPEGEAALRREADAHLEAVSAPLDGRGWAIDRRVVRGRAAGAILAAADELDADLVVLGSRGHGPIASMLLGSVSAEVAEQARCSILIARATRVSRLLVATDGSECASLIPGVVGEWGSFRGLPSIALSVTPVDTPAFDLMVRLYTMGSTSLYQDREGLRERYRLHAAEMAASLSAAGIPTRAEERSGDAAHEIIEAAAEAHVDLILTGSRCLHGLDRWFLGSVARNVLLHTRASVLIVRQKGEPGRS